mmetsp:Transcript_30902/g.48150  ORF Transcript_30902/g.48150 Transcript_30902/m.48150 type:complete len:182 (-) Transcript_30902:165-710(-)
MEKLLVVVLFFVVGVLSQDLYPYDGRCVSPGGDTLYFCQNIEYPFFLADGDTVYEVEMRAQNAYLTASLVQDSCCLLPYRDYICSAFLPRCVEENNRPYPLYTCSNWLCEARISDGINVNDCFSCDSYLLTDSPCTCPINNSTDNDDCLPWEVYSCLDNSSSALAPALGLMLVVMARLLWL